MRGLKTFLIVTAAFVVFHFAFGWSWRETLLAPAVLLVLFLALSAYEIVVGKRRSARMTPPRPNPEAVVSRPKDDGCDSKLPAS
jgi:membrane protein implicated in regulation of membrane protease activity